jgi:hypothetical protein
MASFVSFVAVLSSLTALIAFIGVSIKALDRVVDDIDKEIIRQKIVNFWVSTAELSTFESVGRALKSRYRQMKRNIPMFLRLYWFVLLIMFIVICVENHNKSADELEKDFMGSITIDFSVLANTYYIEAVPNYDSFCDKHQKSCTQLGDELAWRHEVSRTAQLESSYNELLPDIEKQRPFWLEVGADAAGALVIVILAIPLSLSLLLLKLHIMASLLDHVLFVEIRRYIVFGRIRRATCTCGIIEHIPLSCNPDGCICGRWAD